MGRKIVAFLALLALDIAGSLSALHQIGPPDGGYALSLIVFLPMIGLLNIAIAGLASRMGSWLSGPFFLNALAAPAVVYGSFSLPG